MLRELAIGTLSLRADPDATRAVYAQWRPAACACSYCRNFVRAVQRLPQALVDALRSLGIDESKPNEIVEYGPSNGGRRYGVEWAFLGPDDPGRATSTIAGRLSDGLSISVSRGGIPDGGVFPPQLRW